LIDSITAEKLGKCYRLGRSRNNQEPGWLARLAKVFRRGGAEPASSRAPREIWALKDVSFGVQPGTILGIIGANGAGKTTLLKVLGRVTLPTEGRAVVKGRVVSLLEVGAGFQPELSGRENAYLHAALYGLPRGEVARRLDEIVEWAELRDFIDTPVKRYSSGMYLRLAFSVAINMEPDILLADEVLAVGDLAFQERCLQRVEEVGRAGLTVLFVSHDMAAVRRLCHRVIWLNAGRVVADGEPDEVVSRYEDAAWSLVSSKRKRVGSLANAYGELLATRMVSASGKELGAGRRSEEIFLKFTFKMLTAGVEVVCIVDIFARGIHVFRSRQPGSTSIPRPGVYSATVRIPAHLLLDIVYSVGVKLLIQDGGAERSSLSEDNAISFRVYDADESSTRNRTSKRRRDGLLMPELDWSIVEEPALVTV
jgi:lipopolysaccharide transport system ATP-binding protein